MINFRYPDNLDSGKKLSNHSHLNQPGALARQPILILQPYCANLHCL